MNIHKYKNYKEYEDSQKAANMKKKSNVWAVEQNIKFLSEYLSAEKKILGLCHGTRTGKEIEWFRKHIPCTTVFGTEIGDASAPNTIQWDFNKENPEWVGKFDFIYSNSFDHAFDPKETINIWAKQLKPGGLILLEYDKRQEHTGEISKKANKTDPVSITVDEIIEFLPQWIDGAKMVDVLDMPIVKIGFQKTIVVRINE